MKGDDKLRTSVRLKIEQGIVLLRFSGVPSVACTLVDLSEGGCCCVAPLSTLDAQTAAAWRKILAESQPLSVEISSPPHLQHLPLDVEIRNQTQVEGGAVELGLRFHNVEANQRQLLNQAILLLATDKVRGAFSLQPAAGAAQYLIGGRSLPPSGMRPATGGTAAPSAAHSVPAAPVAPAPAPAPVPVYAPEPEPQSELEEPEPAPAPSLPPPWRAKPGDPASGLHKATPPPPPPPSPMAADDGSATTQIEEETEAPASPAAQPAVVPEPVIPTAQGDPFRGKKVGEILVRMGKLSPEQVQEAVQKAKISGERLGRYLLREGLLSPSELCRGLALQSGLPMTDLNEAEISEPLGMIFPYALMMRHEFVPFDQSAKMLCIAAANPLAEGTLIELERTSGKKIEVFLAEEDLVLTHVDKLQPKEKRQERKHMRYEATLPVTFQFCNRLGRSSEEAIHKGQTVDISEGGFLIEGPVCSLGTPDTLLRRGLCVRLVLTMEPLEVKGLCSMRFIKVQDTTASPERAWVFGLQVLEMGSEDRRKLKEICIQAGLRMAKGHPSPRPFPSPNP